MPKPKRPFFHIMPKLVAAKKKTAELKRGELRFPERLEEETLKRIRARFFHDNLLYWWKKARPEQKNNMASYTRTLSRLFSNPSHAEAAEKAANALAAGKPETAKELLSVVFPKPNKTKTSSPLHEGIEPGDEGLFDF